MCTYEELLELLRSGSEKVLMDGEGFSVLADMNEDEVSAETE